MPIKMKKLIKPQKPIKIKTYKLNIKGEFPFRFLYDVQDMIEDKLGKSKHFTPNLKDDGFEIEMHYSSYYMQDPKYRSYLTVNFDLNKISSKDASQIWSNIKGLL